MLGQKYNTLYAELDAGSSGALTGAQEIMVGVLIVLQMRLCVLWLGTAETGSTFTALAG